MTILHISFLDGSVGSELYLGGKFGWGGRIRTFTVLINSEVSYQLDHAPAELCHASQYDAHRKPLR